MICFGPIVVMWCTLLGNPAADAARFCAIYSPVRWSSKDTRGTKEQVDILNRQWKKICAKNP